MLAPIQVLTASCCAQALRCNAGELYAVLPLMLKLYYGHKPTVVGQYLKASEKPVKYRAEHTAAIINELISLDISLYRGSMAPLIQKDIKLCLRTLMPWSLTAVTKYK